jgi:peptidoglycan/xylan/chitin deacetylase (PgdA/CDA1 family)
MSSSPPNGTVPPRPRQPIAPLVAVFVGVLLAVGGFVVGVLPASGATTKPATVVSLTFDDGHADQSAAVTSLAAAKLKGTFFINSGFVDGSGFFTLAQVRAIAAAGNEIGGHTISHPDLTTIGTDEAKRQVCTDRSTLIGWGFAVSDFAYPFSSSTAATESIVKNCGYNSARGLGDLKSRFGCSDCAYAEKIPPTDAYLTKALDEVDSTWTLADLEKSVTNAETKGGWVQLTFHHICTNACDPLAITPTEFSQFTTWLAAHVAATPTTTVKTVAQVIGGTVKPAVAGPAVPTPPPGTNLVGNPSLETTDSSGVPTCWQAGGYGTNTAVFGAGTPAHAGTKAERITVTGYSDGDAKLLQTLDLGTCSPPVTPTHTYSLRAWYISTTATQFAVYLRNSIGVWSYWTSSPWFPAGTSYAQATWTTPAIPAGYTGLSYGLNIFANGSITTDSYEAYDSVGAP